MGTAYEKRKIDQHHEVSSCYSLFRNGIVYLRTWLYLSLNRINIIKTILEPTICEKIIAHTRSICITSHTDEISSNSFITFYFLRHYLQLLCFKAPLWTIVCKNKIFSGLKRAISRLDMITSYDALVLLRACFSAPALQFTLRASSYTKVR